MTNDITPQIDPFSKKARCIDLANRMGLFLKNNWKTIAIHIVVLGIISCLYGVACGFSSVALPFSIFLSIGFGVGLLGGIIVATLIDKNNKWNGKNTLWELINNGLYTLNPNGTRQILLAAVISVISTSLLVFPQGLGFFFGFCFGNYVSTHFCFEINQKYPKPTLIDSEEEAKQQKLKTLNNELKIERLTQRILDLESGNVAEEQIGENFNEKIQSTQKILQLENQIKSLTKKE